MSVYAGDKLVSGGSFEETRHIMDYENPHRVTADQVRLNASSETTIADEMDDLKKSVSDGKALVAGAITSKRVETASDATFAEMAANIDSIKLGSGNAQPSQVLSGATFSNSSGDELTGTMTNFSDGHTKVATLTSADSRPVLLPNTSVANDGPVWLTQNSDGVTRLSMKSPGEGYVTANTLVGVPAADFLGTATTNQVLSGAKFTSSNGLNISGSISSKGAQTYTPGTGNQTINAGQYLSGAQTIKGDANLVAANIKKGTTIFGVTGSLVENPLSLSNCVTKTVTLPSSSTGSVNLYLSNEVPIAVYVGDYSPGTGFEYYNGWWQLYRVADGNYLGQSATLYYLTGYTRGSITGSDVGVTLPASTICIASSNSNGCRTASAYNMFTYLPKTTNFSLTYSNSGAAEDIRFKVNKDGTYTVLSGGSSYRFYYWYK